MAEVLANASAPLVFLIFKPDFIRISLTQNFVYSQSCSLSGWLAWLATSNLWPNEQKNIPRGHLNPVS